MDDDCGYDLTATNQLGLPEKELQDARVVGVGRFIEIKVWPNYNCVILSRHLLIFSSIWDAIPESVPGWLFDM